MNILSLFDGMSCGMIALERAGFKVENYYASEIDKYAMKVSAANYPNIIQLGDVRKVTTKGLPQIDLLIGGSPCQDFSRGNSERLGLLGDKSGLFSHYVRLLEESKSKYYLLENVIMDRFYRDGISEILGVNPIRLNSSLVSAQLRDRLYWTNIPIVGLPEDKKTLLQDVLTDGYTDRKKSRCLLVSDSRPLTTPKKMFHRYKKTGFTTLAFSSNDFDWEKGIRYFNKKELEELQTVPKNYTKCLTRNQAAAVLGNGWTVDVIAWILQFMDEEKREEIRKNQKQTTLFDLCEGVTT